MAQHPALQARLQLARGELALAQDALLRADGWTETCQTPGSYWLWSRTLKDGRTILVGRETALRMTESGGLE